MVEVEADIGAGLPGTVLVGLPQQRALPVARPLQGCGQQFRPDLAELLADDQSELGQPAECPQQPYDSAADQAVLPDHA
jgi:hypothetical protein